MCSVSGDGEEQVVLRVASVTVFNQELEMVIREVVVVAVDMKLGQSGVC